MEKLSVQEVTVLLREHALPDILLETLSENFIDGEALAELPNDFQEFVHLVPQSGLRIKLKAAIEKLLASNLEQLPEKEPSLGGLDDTSLGKTAQFISSSMAATLNFDPLDKDWLGDEFSVPTPPPQDDFLSSSTPDPVPPSKRKHDYPNPAPKQQPAVDPEEQNSGPNKVPLQPVPSMQQHPQQCPVPNNFSRKTTEAIERGDLVGTAKTRLLREAATFYFGVCSGRCSLDYVTIAKTLCREYPQLKDKMTANGEYWKTVKDYMSQKFRNLRRKSEPVPSNGQVKSKIITAQHATPVVAFHQSSTLEEGDAVAYERNIQLLKNELSKVSPNNNRMHQLLKLTHATRRRQIENSYLHAVTLKEEYPFLGFKKWVKAEFSLLCGEAAVETITKNLLKFAPKVLQYGGHEVPESIEEDDLMKVMETIDKGLRGSGQGARAPGIYSLHEAGTDIQSVLKEKVYNEPRLLIFVNKATPSLTQAFVAAEKELLFEVGDFTVTEGIISLLATYWAYHVQYPKPLPSLNFMLFIQEVLLEKRDETGVQRSAKYSKLVNYIL